MGSANTANSHEQVGDRYRDNFSRDLLALARYFQKRMMTALQQECGHADLRLGYAAYIALVGTRAMRLTDLADAIGVSRQACNQAVKQIEAAGYMESRPHPSDGRARQLALSARGQALLDDGIAIAAQLDNQFRDILGDEAFAESSTSLRMLHQALLLTPGSEEQGPTAGLALGGLLPRLSDYVFRHLMYLTIDKGHPGLKLSFGQVLMFLGPRGGRIQHMAAVHDVSKQAISAIASELEALGYLERQPDPRDARQILLYLTPSGRNLIRDSVDSLEEMERGFGTILGKRRFQRLKLAFRRLYARLPLEAEHLVTQDTQELDVLARKLRQQLGPDGCKRLASLLQRPD